MIDEGCLQYRLTDREQEQFDTDGYLVVENALTNTELDQLNGAVDRGYELAIEEGLKPDAVWIRHNFLTDDVLFEEFVDNPKVLPKVWGILGWNIYLYHAHLIVTPPKAKHEKEPTYRFHQDSGRINKDVECSPRPRLSVKVGYYLSDASVEGRGNFAVIPGSQFEDSPPFDPGGGMPPDAIQILAPEGSAVIFDRRLWHAATPNTSDVPRKVATYGYSYRWLHTKDDTDLREAWKRSDPIRRQILGYSEDANGRYSPTDNDVPLRVWLREHDPSSSE